MHLFQGCSDVNVAEFYRWQFVALLPGSPASVYSAASHLPSSRSQRFAWAAMATEGLLQGQLGSGIVYTMCTQPTLLLLDRWCLGLVLGTRRTMGGSTGAPHSEESR